MVSYPHANKLLHHIEKWSRTPNSYTTLCPGFFRYLLHAVSTQLPIEKGAHVIQGRSIIIKRTKQMGVNRLNSVQKATNLKKIKSGNKVDVRALEYRMKAEFQDVSYDSHMTLTEQRCLARSTIDLTMTSGEDSSLYRSTKCER